MAVVAGVLATIVAIGPAAAQNEPWSPAPAIEPAPPPEEGGGVGLQILAGLGIGAAAVGLMVAAHQADRDTAEIATWGLAVVTPPAAGLAICTLGRRSERSTPSCPRAVVAASIGSLIAIPVLLITFLAAVDWGPDPDTSDDDRDEILLVGTTALAWVGGMTAGAIIFGRRRLWRPAVVSAPAAPPAPRWPARPAPLTDDPRQPRWAGAAPSGQLLFRVLSFDF
jgi:hypothetical protein